MSDMPDSCSQIGCAAAGLMRRGGLVRDTCFGTRHVSLTSRLRLLCNLWTDFQTLCDTFLDTISTNY